MIVRSIFLFFLLVSIVFGAALNIADGGTNSATALGNNKIMCSIAGAIVECPGVKSNGSNIEIVASGVSITKQAGVMLNLIGNDNSQNTGPHLHTYGSADGYPLFELLGYSHNNIGLCWDCYFDGSHWRSSHNTGSFQLYKLSNSLRIRYTGNSSQGAGITFSDAVIISTTGATTINSLQAPVAVINSLIAPFATVGSLTVEAVNATSINFGGTNLSHYSEDSYSFSTSGAFVGTQQVKAVRVGKMVTLTFLPLIGTAVYAETLNIVVTNLLPGTYFPTPQAVGQTTVSTPVFVNNGAGSVIGRLDWTSEGSCILDNCQFNQNFRFTANAGGGQFSTGSNRGHYDSVSMTFYKQ